MTGRRGSRRANSASSRPQMGPEQSHVGTRQEQPRQETRAGQPRHETRVEQPRPSENVGNLTLEQLAPPKRGEYGDGRDVEENTDVEAAVGKESTGTQEKKSFSLAILEEGLPQSFRKSNVGEYDECTDPEEHLERFDNTALLHQYSDEVKCKVFLDTLVRFASSKRHQRNYLSLFVMKQQETETLREFIRRFNDAALDIPDASPDIIISAFTQGLRGGEFFKSLVKKPPSSYDDLLSRAEKYVNLEDAQRHKRMEQRSGGSRVEGAERGGRKRGAGERENDKTRGRGQFSSHVPLDRSRDKVREPEERWEKSQRVESSARLTSGDIREGSASGSRPRSRPSPRRGQGPTWINERDGEQRGECRGQDVPQEPVEPRRGMNEDNHPTRGMIHMISGGATDGESVRARKAHGRRLENFDISRGTNLPQDLIISFGPEDLRDVVTPHNDALVVTTTIVNYDVARIFIDNGSSINVLFKSTLDQMKVK
ncbi:uncharacterized protein [Primulina huaijiensis]|uniref:uncharacterized protein n=1 Tax=Primulina huaijiensis TaxID=1492673 RepID=UPI003CC72D49